MPASTPIRIDDDLYAAAKAVARARDRSTAQQIAHWARIGREIEASRTISVGAVEEVLAGRGSYDTLGAEEQAVVRAEWGRRLDAVAEGIDLTERFAREGRHTWIDIGPDGEVLRRD